MTNRNRNVWKMLLIASIIIMSGCNFPTRYYSSDQVNGLYTQVANTMVAQMTKSVFETLASGATQGTGLQNTAIPPVDNVAPATPIIPSATNIPATATNTAIPPTATPRPLPCDWARYVEDVTIEDGEIIPAGLGFYKVWRLKNIGACTWTTDYALVYASGDRMGGAKVVPLPYAVPPGATVDAAVYLTAPEDIGEYRGYWMLLDDSGNIFGIGPNANGAFWVDIEVKAPLGPQKTPYDFVANYCSAKWSNASTILPCPGKDTSEDGFVIRLNNPWPEKGGLDDEPALWVHPEFIKKGKITGQYPPVLIKDGNHLVTTVGCLKDSLDCDVMFSIYYKADDGPVTLLGEWHEVYDKMVTPIGLDLSSLKGKNVVFFFVVDANGSYKGDNAFWLWPTIH